MNDPRHDPEACADSRCPICLTLVGYPHLPGGQGAGRAAREARCPDGGYCHGSGFAAGSPPCQDGTCWRVQTAGPLSGIYPGDRWPDSVIAARGSDDQQIQVLERAVRPNGVPLRDAIVQVIMMQRVLQAAMGSRDGHEVIAGHLAVAAKLARQVGDLIVEAHHNLTGEPAIKHQGQVYADSRDTPPQRSPG